MAVAARVDQVTKNPDGSVNVVFAKGAPPLGVPGDRQGLGFGDLDAVKDTLERFEEKLAEDIVLFLLSVGYKADPNVGAQFNARTVGKTVTIDITGLAASIAFS